MGRKLDAIFTLSQIPKADVQFGGIEFVGELGEVR